MQTTEGDEWAVSLLGPFDLRCKQRRIAVNPGQAAQLIKRLALTSAPVPVEAVIEWFWPDADPVVGRRRLRNLLNRLGPMSPMLVQRNGDMLMLSDVAVVDALEFKRCADRVLFTLPLTDHEQVIAEAERVVALYAGDLLPDEPYEDWAIAPRLQLRGLFVGLHRVLADAWKHHDGARSNAYLTRSIELVADEMPWNCSAASSDC